MADLGSIFIFWLAVIWPYSLVSSQLFNGQGSVDLETYLQGNNTEICPVMMKLVYGDIRYHCRCKLNSDDPSHPSPCYTQNKMKQNKMEIIAKQLISKTERFNQDDWEPRMSSSSTACGSCIIPPKCCDSVAQVLFPLYGYSILTQSMVRIVQETEGDITQPVLFRQCLSRKSNVVRGSCRQSYLPRLMYVYTNTSGRGYPYTQDVILMPSTCDCFLNMESISPSNSSSPVTDSPVPATDSVHSTGTPGSNPWLDFDASQTIGSSSPIVRSLGQERTSFREWTSPSTVGFNGSVVTETFNSTQEMDGNLKRNSSPSSSSPSSSTESYSGFGTHLTPRMVFDRETGKTSRLPDLFADLGEENVGQDKRVEKMKEIHHSLNKTFIEDHLGRNFTVKSSAKKWESQISFHQTRKEISHKKDGISPNEMTGLQHPLKELAVELSRGDISANSTGVGKNSSTWSIWSYHPPSHSSPSSQQVVPVEMTTEIWNTLPESQVDDAEEDLVSGLNKSVPVSETVAKEDDDEEDGFHSTALSERETVMNQNDYEPGRSQESVKQSVINKEEMAVSSVRVDEKSVEIPSHVDSSPFRRQQVGPDILKPYEKFQRKIGFSPALHQSFTATSF